MGPAAEQPFRVYVPISARFRIRQQLPRPRVADVPAAVETALAALNFSARVRPGQHVAITAGSRGLANIAFILRAAVVISTAGCRAVHRAGHGQPRGGDRGRPAAVIESYGITEDFLGCPIRASMETVVVCRAAEGFPVHFDRHAFQADHVLVCNRIKPHTRFVGDVESGLMKMLLIGLGKRAGATVYHRAIQDYSFGQIIRSVAGEVLSRCRILAGVAIVENAFDRPPGRGRPARRRSRAAKRSCCAQAKRWMAATAVRRVDVLLIDEIGKDISGTGLDTNVVGRKFDEHRARRRRIPQDQVHRRSRADRGHPRKRRRAWASPSSANRSAAGNGRRTPPARTV